MGKSNFESPAADIEWLVMMVIQSLINSGHLWDMVMQQVFRPFYEDQKKKRSLRKHCSRIFLNPGRECMEHAFSLEDLHSTLPCFFLYSGTETLHEQNEFAVRGVWEHVHGHSFGDHERVPPVVV